MRNAMRTRNTYVRTYARTFVFLELCMTKFHRAQNERTNVAAMWQPHTYVIGTGGVPPKVRTYVRTSAYVRTSTGGYPGQRVVVL